MSKRRRLTSLKLTAIAAVDNPCQEGARAAIIKRAPESAGEPAVELAKYICAEDGAHTFQEVLSENAFSEAVWPMTDALTQSIRSIMGDKELSGADREARVATSVQEFLSAVREKAPDAEKRLLGAIKQRTSNMTELEKLQAKVDQLTGQMTAETAKVATLTSERDAAVQRAEKAEGDKKELEEEIEKVRKASPDESITIDGTVVSKSVVGDTQFAVLKSQQARIEKAEERAELAMLEKRAEIEFPHVSGTAAEKALLLKHVNDLPEEVRKTATEVLNSAERLAKAGFERLGATGPQNPTAKAAEGTFMAKVSEIQARDKCGQADAMSKARTEFPTEFAAYREATGAN